MVYDRHVLSSILHVRLPGPEEADTIMQRDVTVVRFVCGQTV